MFPPRSGQTSGTRTSKSRVVAFSVAAALAFAAVIPVAHGANRVLPGSNRPGTSSATTSKRSPVARFDAPWAEYIQTVVADLDQFGTQIMSTHYRKAYTPLGGYFAYSETSLPPSCGRRMSYREIRGNAFYCTLRDYIAFDIQTLFPDIEEDFGTVALGMVLAHEFGHAIQARTRTKFSSVLQELQADCFAGAWLARAASSSNRLLAVDTSRLDDALIATLLFRDPPGIGATATGAHGNGFDRLGAVQRGFEGGPARCADFARNPPEVTASEFVDFTDFQNEGDLPYDSALEVSERTLRSYFAQFDQSVAEARTTLVAGDTIEVLSNVCPSSTVYQAFAGLCNSGPGERVELRIDGERLRRLYDREGDAAVGFAMALSRAAALQQRRGVATAGNAAEQQRLCLAGGWLRTVANSDGTSALSPDDLDEAVFVALRLPQTSTAFDLIRAMRSGFLNPSPCGI